jgi:hypothetical protein
MLLSVAVHNADDDLDQEVLYDVRTYLEEKYTAELFFEGSRLS